MENLRRPATLNHTLHANSTRLNNRSSLVKLSIKVRHQCLTFLFIFPFVRIREIRFKTKTQTGFQGIQKLHSNRELPKKRSKKNPLTRQDKKNNREISCRRMLIRNLIRELKKFRILARSTETAGADFFCGLILLRHSITVPLHDFPKRSNIILTDKKEENSMSKITF